MLPGEADQLVGEARDQRQQQDPLRDQPVPVRPPEEGEHEHREHHHPEHERGAATRMDEREPLHDLRLERLAGLIGVDRLVLGRVVLEHAAQVRQQRDQAEVRDEDRDADQPLDDHEPAGALDGQQLGEQPRRDLEEHDGEADRDREREDQCST